jgi:hypothetical protein
VDGPSKPSNTGILRRRRSRLLALLAVSTDPAEAVLVERSLAQVHQEIEQVHLDTQPPAPAVERGERKDTE